jgi:hypothetical protein
MCASATLVLMALFAVSVVWVIDQVRRRRDLTAFADDIGRFFDEHDVM